MNEYFVEILNESNNWIPIDNKKYPTFNHAKNHAYDIGITDETYFFRINVCYNDKYSYYGPCH